MPTLERDVPTGTLNISVRDPAGKPVEFAFIELYHLAFAGYTLEKYELVKADMSNGAGAARFDRLLVGPSDDYHYEVSHRDYRPQEQMVTLLPEGPYELHHTIQLEKKKPMKLAFDVRFDDNSPLPFSFVIGDGEGNNLAEGEGNGTAVFEPRLAPSRHPYILNVFVLGDFMLQGYFERLADEELPIRIRLPRQMPATPLTYRIQLLDVRVWSMGDEVGLEGEGQIKAIVANPPGGFTWPPEIFRLFTADRDYPHTFSIDEEIDSLTVWGDTPIPLIYGRAQDVDAFGVLNDCRDVLGAFLATPDWPTVRGEKKEWSIDAKDARFRFQITAP